MRSGFSLVELSIVLVILGLLTGGILTGQNLIRAAELRSVVTEFKNYQTAVMTFRDKYFALPGDMKNAEQFWGTMATGTCPNATAGTGTQTCNGDGDGRIEHNQATGANRTSERFTFWQHLTNSGLIEGSYTGIAGSLNGIDHVLGINAPKGKIGNMGWSVRNTQVQSGTAWFDGDYGTVLRTGSLSALGEPSTSYLTPTETWGIDKKIDDGQPAYGKLIVLHNGCTNAIDSADKAAQYSLSEDSYVCAAILANIF